MRIALLSLLLFACAEKAPNPGQDSDPPDSGDSQDTDVAPVDADGDGDPSVETGGGDCDDSDPSVSSLTPEICDGLDQDCDGVADDDPVDGETWYTDADGDLYGDPNAPLSACDRPSGAVADHTDCDDTEFTVKPGAEEVCGDGLDNDCDGSAGDCRLEGKIDLGASPSWVGETLGDQLGAGLAGGGDLDGDGAADLALGNPGEDSAGARAGAVWVLRGPLDETGGDDPIVLTGQVSEDVAGAALAVLDLDGDGLAELVVGGPGGESGAGIVWIVSEPEAGSLSQAGARLVGASGVDEAGTTLGSAGDLDGDGAPELLIGAPGADASAGAVYVIGGALSGEVDLGEAATVWTGERSRDEVGPAAGLGDLDGDGVPDLAIGAPGESSAGENAGAVALLTEPGGGSLADGTLWLGEAEGDAAGVAVAGVGDTDGDGYADVLVGGPNNDDASDYAGACWLLLGPASLGGSLSGADATRTGASAAENAGGSLAAPGDIDGDGFADLVVGSPWGDGGASNSGVAWILYGPVSGTASLSTSDAELQGEDSYDRASTSLAAAGDLNGDGAPDLLIGAPNSRDGGSDAGKAYLVFGLGL